MHRNLITRRTRIGLLFAGTAVVLAGCGSTGGMAASTPQQASPPVLATPPSQAPVPAVTAWVPARTAPPAPKPAAPPAPKPAAAVPAPPAAAPPSVPDYPTTGVSCEDGLEHVDELGALGADCDTARRVAAAVDTKILLLGEVPLEPFNAVDGWVCVKDRGSFEEYVYIACDRGDSRMESVSFGWGT